MGIIQLISIKYRSINNNNNENISNSNSINKFNIKRNQNDDLKYYRKMSYNNKVKIKSTIIIHIVSR